MLDTILEKGFHYVEGIQRCFCFVADGVGGAPFGEFTAQFVLGQIREKILPRVKLTKDEISDSLSSINNELINFGRVNIDYHGTGTTLVGIIKV